jgi:hypothetical protein
MKSFRLEKQSRKEIGGTALFLGVLGIFWHGAWIGATIASIIWLIMGFTKNKQN